MVVSIAVIALFSRQPDYERMMMMMERGEGTNVGVSSAVLVSKIFMKISRFFVF